MPFATPEEIRTLERRLGGVGLVALTYGAWMLHAALTALIALGVRQLLLFTVVIRFGTYARRAPDELALIIMAVLWLGWVVLTEGIYRHAAGRGATILLRLVARVTVVLVVVLLLLGTGILLTRPR